jgi:6-phosphogluconolactonase (cycloisomerase 2 family)
MTQINGLSLLMLKIKHPQTSLLKFIPKILCVLLYAWSTTSLVHASSKPTFLIAPISINTISLDQYSVATMQYRVTNQTSITRQLTMVPVRGISITPTQPGDCTSPFTLDPQQSCILRLIVNGASIPNTVTRGPEICKTQPNSNTPDPFLCAEPSKAGSFDIIKRATVAYTANFDSSRSITKCDIDINGLLSNCEIAANNSTLDKPNDVTINSSKTILYASNQGDKTIQICRIAPLTGALDCTNSGDIDISRVNIQGIVINADNSLLYVANANGEILQCPISEDGLTVSACTTSASSITNTPLQITINTAGTVVYVVGETETIQCSVTNSPEQGNLGACKNVNINPADYPNNGRGIAIDSNDAYAYISGLSSITGCEIDSGTGDFINCARVNSVTLGEGRGLSVNSTNTYVYTGRGDSVDDDGTFIGRCDISNGTVSNCITTGNNNLGVTSYGIGLIQ